MEQVLRIAIPLYYVLYFLVTFLVASLRVAKATGSNPMLFPKDDSVQGLMGFYLKAIIFALFAYLTWYACQPDARFHRFDMEPVIISAFKWSGILLLVPAIVITVVAQINMRESWRIGIQHKLKTELITSGVFRFSRNPVFLGMIMSLLALFLLLPNAFTLFLFISAYMQIQVQIRMEEEYLAMVHGQSYLNYKRTVRRLI